TTWRICCASASSAKRSPSSVNVLPGRRGSDAPCPGRSTPTCLYPWTAGQIAPHVRESSVYPWIHNTLSPYRRRDRTGRERAKPAPCPKDQSSCPTRPPTRNRLRRRERLGARRRPAAEEKFADRRLRVIIEAGGLREQIRVAAADRTPREPHRFRDEIH